MPRMAISMAALRDWQDGDETQGWHPMTGCTWSRYNDHREVLIEISPVPLSFLCSPNNPTENFTLYALCTHNRPTFDKPTTGRGATRF